jgi:hypothetical protein
MVSSLKKNEWRNHFAGADAGGATTITVVPSPVAPVLPVAPVAPVLPV